MSITDLAALATITGVFGAGSFEAVRILRRVERKFSTFQSDWDGTPERPGVPRRAGVMERLDVMEHELTFNSGSSLKDAVHRIDETINGRRP